MEAEDVMRSFVVLSSLINPQGSYAYDVHYQMVPWPLLGFCVWIPVLEDVNFARKVMMY